MVSLNYSSSTAIAVPLLPQEKVDSRLCFYSTLPMRACVEIWEKYTFPSFVSINDFGTSSKSASVIPFFSLPLRNFFVSCDTVAVSISKMPIMFFRRRFLLFPACKNILRRPFVFFAFLCPRKETLAKKRAKGQTGLNFAYAKFCTRFPLWNPLLICART